LRKSSADIVGLRNSLYSAAVQIWNAQRQAELDKLALTAGLTTQQKFVGIGLALLCGCVLFGMTIAVLNSGPERRVERSTTNTPNVVQKASPVSSPPPPAASKDLQDTMRNTEVGKRSWADALPPRSTMPRDPRDVPTSQIPPWNWPREAQRFPVPLPTPEPFPSQVPPSAGSSPDLSLPSETPPSNPSDATPPLPEQPSLPMTLPSAPDASPRSEVPLSPERIGRIQSRLRELGFSASAVTRIWDANTRAAVRDFKIVNHMANDDVLDTPTEARLNSHLAVRANQSFLGVWTSASCRGPEGDALLIVINTRRARSSGGACEFESIESENPHWRIRATCADDTKRWTSNIKFTVRGNQLTWQSERDARTYLRCR
jgi:hypothetical protein